MSNERRQQILTGFDDQNDDNAQSSPHEPPETVDHPADETPESLTSLEDKVVYVIDAHALIYQVFHALPEMSGPNGQPVGAIHGFIRDMVDVIENKKPDYLFCAFDHSGPTFRHDIFADYKVNREAMPDDLRPQIKDIQRMLAALGIAFLSIENYEADDILATFARLCDELSADCFLVTSDKDCRQLITNRVKMYNIRKSVVLDEAAVIEDWGIRPDQVVDFQAMWGDSTDNIPGIPGVGKKTAGELLAKYESLEGVFEHAHEITAKKRRENILNNREQAFISRQLVKLDANVPFTVDWNAGRIGGIDHEQVSELCNEFGFRGLAERLDGLSVKQAPATWEENYQTVSSLEQLDQLVDTMLEQDEISIDTETTSTNPRWAEIVGYSFAWTTGEAYYLPVKSPAGDIQLDAEIVREKLRCVLENPNIKKVGQNLKYDIIVLRNVGIEMRGLAFDTMVADYLLDPGQRNHSVDDLSKRYLNHTTIKISELIGTGKKQKRMDEVPVELVTPYAAEDADVPLRLRHILGERLSEEGFDELYHQLEIPLIDVLVEMEFNGIKVDVALLGEMSDRFAKRLAILESEIYDIAGGEFNIDSRLQLGKILFETFELPIIKKTAKGDPSTDVEVLNELATQHALPAKIIEYRQNAKLKSTYVDALPQLVHPQTGRVHTSFRQDVAATGRLSSTEPNLQNIPIRTNEGREIRSAFIPGEDGWSLLAADYSQIELRVLAHFSGDEALQTAFREDHDIHAQVAAEVFSVPLDEVTSELRRRAKAVNFGVIYGQSAFGLAKALNIDKDEAAEFIDAYFNKYTGVDAFITKTLEECRVKGYVSTLLGRRRAVQGVRDTSKRGDSRQRSLPERIAINTVIQGSAADLIKQAMINVHGRMQREELQARMLLQIHDELVFELPSDELQKLASLVKQEMAGVGQLDVPLTIDMKTGPNWAACEPLS